MTNFNNKGVKPGMVQRGMYAAQPNTTKQTVNIFLIRFY